MEESGARRKIEEDYKHNSKWGHRVCIVQNSNEKVDKIHYFPDGTYTLHNITPDGKGYYFDYNPKKLLKRT